MANEEGMNTYGFMPIAFTSSFYTVSFSSFFEATSHLLWSVAG